MLQADLATSRFSSEAQAWATSQSFRLTALQCDLSELLCTLGQANPLLWAKAAGLSSPSPQQPPNGPRCPSRPPKKVTCSWPFFLTPYTQIVSWTFSDPDPLVSLVLKSLDFLPGSSGLLHPWVHRAWPSSSAHKLFDELNWIHLKLHVAFFYVFVELEQTRKNFRAGKDHQSSIERHGLTPGKDTVAQRAPKSKFCSKEKHMNRIWGAGPRKYACHFFFFDSK